MDWIAVDHQKDRPSCALEQRRFRNSMKTSAVTVPSMHVNRNCPFGLIAEIRLSLKRAPVVFHRRYADRRPCRPGVIVRAHRSLVAEEDVRPGCF